MPPKPKFTKQQMIDEALQLIQEEGAVNLTARNLGKRLGVSQTPIFVWFSSMEDLRHQVELKGLEILKEYLNKGLADSIPFRGVGNQYIKFAEENPNLYEFMFMMETSIMMNMDHRYVFLDEEIFNGIITKSIKETYDVNDGAADQIARHMLIYAHGIASLYAKHVCFFSKEEISEMLRQVCLSLVAGYKTVKGIEDESIDTIGLFAQYHKK